MVGFECDADREQTIDLAIQNRTRQAIWRKRAAQQPSRLRVGLEQRHPQSASHQVIRGREPCGARSDHRDLRRVRRLRLGRIVPTFSDRAIAKKALDAVDRDWLIVRSAIADAFARMMADAASDRGERIRTHQHLPGAAQIPLRNLRQIRLRIFSRRTSGSARRVGMMMLRALKPPIAGLQLKRGGAIRKAAARQDRHGVSITTIASRRA